MLEHLDAQGQLKQCEALGIEELPKAVVSVNRQSDTALAQLA